MPSWARSRIVFSLPASVLLFRKPDQKVDVGEAKKTIFGTLSRFTNTVPIAGHVKGFIHYIQGDKKRGDEAMKEASRPVGVLFGGVGGFWVGGFIGAGVGGVAGGVAVDSLTTFIESIVERQFTPSGSILLYYKLFGNPIDAALWLRLSATVARDAFVGGYGGEVLCNYSHWSIIISNTLSKTFSKDQLTKMGMKLALNQPILHGRDITALLSMVSVLLQSPSDDD